MATLTQQQVEQWIAQNGGPSGLQYGVEQKTVRNPDFGIANPTAPEYVPIEVEVWRNPTTKAALTVRRQASGDFEQIESVGALPNTTTATAEPPKTEDVGGTRYVWQPNPGGAGAGGTWAAVGPAPLTPAERAAQDAAAPSQSVRTEAGGDGKTYTVITLVPKPGQPGQPGQIVLGPDGQSAPGGVPGKPLPQSSEPISRGGKTYIQVKKQNPDGSVSITFTDQAGTPVTLPDEPSQDRPVTITRNGKTYVQHQVTRPDGTADIYWTDQAGQRVQLPEEIKPGDYVPRPAGVPDFQPDFTQPDLGLGARRRVIDELVNKGVLDKQQALDVLTEDAGRAKAAGENAGAIVNIQEGNRRAALEARQQDALDISGRRQFAGSTFNQALSTLTPVGMSFIPGPGSAEAAANGFLASLALARAHAGESGGMRELPGYDLSQYPMLQGFGQAGLPGLPGGPPLGPQWAFPGVVPGAAPAAGPDSTMVRPMPGAGVPGPPPGAAVPNALGLGAIGAVPAPGGATATAALPAPLLPPPPPVALPSPVLPTTPPVSMPPVRDDWRMPGTAPLSPPAAMPTLPGPSPAAGVLQRAWGQHATPGYTGLELGQDLLHTGFDPDVIASVMGRGRGMV